MELPAATSAMGPLTVVGAEVVAAVGAGEGDAADSEAVAGALEEPTFSKTQAVMMILV